MKTILRYFSTSLLIAALFHAFLDGATKIPGTAVSIEPPDGFQKADRFPGFLQEETGASIMVTEIPGPYSKVTAGFSKNGFQSRGMTLLAKEDIMVSAQKGVLLHVAQTAQGIRFLKWILVSGNSKKTTMVTASFPERFKEQLSQKLKDSMKSTRVGVSLSETNNEGLAFRIHPAAGLKVATRFGNNLLLTKNGKFPAPSPTDPVLVVGSSLSQGLPIPKRREFSANRIHRIDVLQDVKINVRWPRTDGFLAG